MTAAPGQTAGPFFHLGLPFTGGNELVPSTHREAVHLHGRVLDGDAEPVPDALIELWQPAPSGSIAAVPGSLHRTPWTFTGWGRAATDAAGRYWFSTLTPGPPGFFALAVFARGLTDRLFTRAYLPGAAGPFLDSLPSDRRQTLLAVADDGGLRFDVRLQGDDETVFLSFPRHRGLWP